jgi:hypothetical protein
MAHGSSIHAMKEEQIPKLRGVNREWESGREKFDTHSKWFVRQKLLATGQGTWRVSPLL